MLKELVITEDGFTAKLTLRSATIGDSMRRNKLAAQAFTTPLEDDSDQTVAVLLYPRCLACTVTGDINGKPVKELTPAEFVALPEKIGEAWLTAVLELNPDWTLSAPTESEQVSAEKKD